MLAGKPTRVGCARAVSGSCRDDTANPQGRQIPASVGRLLAEAGAVEPVSDPLRTRAADGTGNATPHTGRADAFRDWRRRPRLAHAYGTSAQRSATAFVVRS